MPRQVIRICLRSAAIIVLVIWWLSIPLHSWAETSLPILRSSSTVEKQIQEKVLYFKEETVSIASRYEQPISQAPSDTVNADTEYKWMGLMDSHAWDVAFRTGYIRSYSPVTDFSFDPAFADNDVHVAAVGMGFLCHTGGNSSALFLAPTVR